MKYYVEATDYFDLQFKSIKSYKLDSNLHVA